MAGLTNKKTRLGIFGGTFDPPHVGHLILASEAQFQLRLDKVLWVLTPEPPHKRGRGVTPLDQRLDLLNAALGNDPIFELSRADIDRPAPHFAADTVALLNGQFPGATIIYLMGSDSLAELPTWHAPESFIQQVDEIGVMHRPGWEPDLGALEARLPTISVKARFINAPLLQISSTSIRNAIRSKAVFRYYLPAGVFDLIKKRRLYQEE